MAFFVSSVLAFLYKWPCPILCWMTGRALVCRSGTAFLLDLQFCSFSPETGTRQLDFWAGYQRRRCLWWSGQLNWRGRSLRSTHVRTWNLCCGFLLWSVISVNVTTAQWKKTQTQPKNKTKNKTQTQKNQKPKQINPNLKPGMIKVSLNKQCHQRWEITKLFLYVILYIHSERSVLDRF